VLGRESEGKAPNGLNGKPGRGLLRDMSGVVVEDDFNCGVGRIGGVEEFEKLDELAAPVALFDNGVDVTGQQIDARHQGQGAVAFVLVIAHYGGAGAGKWRTVRRGRADRLDPRFLIVRNDGKAPYVTAFWALAVAICSLGAQASPLDGRRRGFPPYLGSNSGSRFSR